jgi:hypothetical protein
MKKGNAPKPLPGAKEERSALLKNPDPLVSRTQDGKGETVRVVLDVPREWLVLAAWLEIEGDMHDRVNSGMPEITGATPA